MSDRTRRKDSIRMGNENRKKRRGVVTETMPRRFLRCFGISLGRSARSTARKSGRPDGRPLCGMRDGSALAELQGLGATPAKHPVISSLSA